MARSTFGGGSSDFVYQQTSTGLIKVAATTLTFWTAQTGGTQYTDLLLDGVAVATIPVDSSGKVPAFQGPDGVSSMWASAGGGARVRMVDLLQDTASAGLVNDDASSTSAALRARYVRPRGKTTADTVAAAPLPWVNIVDYGASTAAADNKTAIEAAAAAAGTLIIPAGTFDHSGLVLPSVTVLGADRSTSILRYTGTGHGVTGAADWTNLTISDLTLSASGAPTGYALRNTFITRNSTVNRLTITGHKGGIDLHQTINHYSASVRITGQGSGVAGGIGVRSGEPAIPGGASTSTTYEGLYITDFETGVHNVDCVGLILIQPIVEYYLTGIYNQRQTVMVSPHFEAGVAGKISVKSEDAMLCLGGIYESAPSFPTTLGRDRYLAVGADFGQIGVGGNRVRLGSDGDFGYFVRLLNTALTGNAARITVANPAITADGDCLHIQALEATTGRGYLWALGSKMLAWGANGVGFYGTEPQPKPTALTASAAAAPAGGTGTAAGGWDTAANRDAAIATINNLKTRVDELETKLRALGLLT